MSELALIYKSSVGRKYLNGLTGLLLLIFIVEHLIGNLFLFLGKDSFNWYVAFLGGIHEFLYVLECALGLVFLIHALAGVYVFWEGWRARPQGYAMVRSAGPPSRKTLSSRSMIVTGILILAFLIWHLITFRFGPHYTTQLEGKEVRDLYRLVLETFKKPGYFISYEVILILLGLHLRHGFWSAFHTLGLTNPKYARPIVAFAIVFAILVAGIFLLIPPYFYFFVEEVG